MHLWSQVDISDFVAFYISLYMRLFQTLGLCSATENFPLPNLPVIDPERPAIPAFVRSQPRLPMAPVQPAVPDAKSAEVSMAVEIKDFADSGMPPKKKFAWMHL